MIRYNKILKAFIIFILSVTYSQTAFCHNHTTEHNNKIHSNEVIEPPIIKNLQNKSIYGSKKKTPKHIAIENKISNNSKIYLDACEKMSPEISAIPITKYKKTKEENILNSEYLKYEIPKEINESLQYKEQLRQQKQESLARKADVGLYVKKSHHISTHDLSKKGITLPPARLPIVQW